MTFIISNENEKLKLGTISSVRICQNMLRIWLSDATILHTNFKSFPGVAPLMEGGIPPFHTNPPVALRAPVVCCAHHHNFFEPPLAETCVRACLVRQVEIHLNHNYVVAIGGMSYFSLIYILIIVIL